MEARDYTHAFSLFNEALEQGINDTKLKARALNMRGTFKYVDIRYIDCTPRPNAEDPPSSACLGSSLEILPVPSRT